MDLAEGASVRGVYQEEAVLMGRGSGWPRWASKLWAGGFAARLFYVIII
jgi:hypothetical protein